MTKNETLVVNMHLNGVSIRQISHATGLSRYVVKKIIDNTPPGTSEVVNDEYLPDSTELNEPLKTEAKETFDISSSEQAKPLPEVQDPAQEATFSAPGESESEVSSLQLESLQVAVLFRLRILALLITIIVPFTLFSGFVLGQLAMVAVARWVIVIAAGGVGICWGIAITLVFTQQK